MGDAIKSNIFRVSKNSITSRRISRKTTRETKLERAIRVFGLSKSPNDIEANHYYFIYDQRTDDFIRGSKTKLPIVILYTGTEVIDPKVYTTSKKIILKPLNAEYLRQYYTNDNLLFFESTKENLENDKVRLLTNLCIKNGIPYDCELQIQGHAQGITNKSNNQKKERRERRVSRKQRKRKRRRTIRRT